jgi:ABC-2 type transport system permease protein
VRSANRIALKDLKLRLRDRSAIILGVIAPLALAFILNLVFGDAFDTSGGLGLEYGLVDRDQSEISEGFTEIMVQLESEGILTLEMFGEPDTAEAAVEDGELDAYIHLEEGLGQAVLSGETATIEVVGSVDSPTSTQIAASIADSFAIGVDATGLAIATTAQVSGTMPAQGSFEGDPQSAAFSFRLEDISAETRQLDATTYFAAGMAAFFVFFTVQFGVSGLLEEERDGTLARLLAAPIRRESVIAGKGILSFVLGLASMTILVGATSLDFLVGADWGNPLGVLILICAIVLSAIGIMSLVASVAKTPEGAGNLGSIIAVILGMLGGVFFQVGQGDDLLSNLSLITPHAWFMRGLGDLAGDAPWTAALPAAGAMMVFAVITGVIGWVLLRRRLAR